MAEKVSSRQLILLITISRITTILTVMPTIYMSPANQDIWIVILVSFFYTILSCSPLLFLANRFNDSTIIGCIKKIFGKSVGILMGILYGIFFSIIAILFSYVTVQMIRDSFLTETKPIITIIFIIISCTYIISKGLKCISRTAEIFVPVILTMIIFFCILGYNNIDFSVFLPIYKDSTFLGINIGAIQLSLIFVDIYLLAMIVPELENKKEINKIFIKAVLYSILLVLGTIVVTQGSLGIEQAKHSNFPFLTYIRRIRIYATFERIESIYILMWILAMIIKITIYIYISTLAFKEVFNVKDNKIILYIIPASVGIITFYIAEYKPILLEIKSINSIEYTIYFILKTLIPLIAVIVYFFRRKSFIKEGRLES